MNILFETPSVTNAIELEASDLVSTMSTWLDAVLDAGISIFNTAASSPITLAFVCFAIVGVAVGFTKKLLHI